MAVCDAAIHWERSDVSEQTDGAAPAGSASGAYAAVSPDKLHSSGAAEHTDTHSTAAARPANNKQHKLV